VQLTLFRHCTRKNKHLLLKSLIGPRILSAVCCAFLLGTIALDCVAQDRQRGPHKDVLPRVGTIKDYPATGLMTGCGNLYAYPVHRTSMAPDAYVFLSSGDGSNAWMNLGGRDLRLQQIKPLSGKGRKPQQH
jgi:hypothetical protein